MKILGLPRGQTATDHSNDTPYQHTKASQPLEISIFNIFDDLLISLAILPMTHTTYGHGLT